MSRQPHARPGARAAIGMLPLLLGLPGPARASCSNDSGSGDIPESENCLVNLGTPNNDGCNIVPNTFVELNAPVFAGDQSVSLCGIGSNYNTNATCDLNADCIDNNCVGDPNPGDGNAQGICIGPSEPSLNRRDTDWYRIAFAALDAADADNNGVVQVHSQVVSEFNAVTFLVSIGNPACDIVTVLNSVGCGGPQGAVDTIETIIIADHPNGVVVFVAPGQCSGAGIFDGYECADLPALTDYNLTISMTEPPIACADPDLNPNLLPCNTPNQSVPGCNDPACCKQVCLDLPLCCVVGWSQSCAQAAMDLGCVIIPDGPICMATGLDSLADGFLQVCADPMGAWADLTFGGVGDRYNPVGAATVQPAGFSNAFFLYRASAQQRELLANNPDWKAAGFDDASLASQILCVVPGPNCVPGSVASDTDGDQVIDHEVSKFSVTGVGLNLTFDLAQQVDLIPLSGGASISVLHQTYTVHNNNASPISFVMLRQCDFDIVWNGGFSNDSVGTGTNGSPLDRHVFQGEAGLPAMTVTISSPQGAQYVGAKSNVDPDGGSPGPAMGAGTDLQEWDAYGVPQGWGNFIAYVGYNVNGSSGTQSGDGHIDLEIPVSVAANGTTVFTLQHTYGASAPNGGVPEVCGDPASGPCIGVHPNPGCYDLECCAAVCAINPACCTTQWDITCLLTIFSQNITECFDLFEPPQEFIAAGEPIIHVLGDFDNTGTLDVAAAIPDLNPKLTGRVQVFRNLGEDLLGNWLGLTANPTIIVGHAPSGVAAGFFNNDDDLDLAVTNAGDNSVSILLNLGTGNATFVVWSTVPVGNAPSAIFSDDLDEDGLIDLAVTNEQDGTLQILLGDGNGNFTPLAAAVAIPVGLSPVALSSGDFDGNKCPDLAGVNRGASGAVAGTVFVLLGMGGGDFQPPVLYTIGSLPSDLALGDFGGPNSSTDIAAVNTGGSNASFLMNQGNGLFLGPFNLAVGQQPLSIDTVDADGDGDSDVSVVATTPAGRTEQVFLNQGGFFNFFSTLPKSVNAEANFVVSGLIDENAYDDLVTVNEDQAGPTGGSVTVLLNTRDCPWDCGDGDGTVGVIDFLALLGQWPNPGSCDYDGGGVGVTDFLTLLTHWGPCP